MTGASDAGPATHPDVPDVSVIIPAHNAGPYFGRCLESVVAQTIGLDRMEVVVVDDGSSDGTGETADSWAARHPDVFRVVHNEVGSGGPAAPRELHPIDAVPTLHTGKPDRRGVAAALLDDHR